ncbi:MAG: ABC transporter permease [Erysipelotrichaceae bacterium]|nr:ABC transporter permease [Erysipelotrichaceae bacterium]
MKNKFKLNLDGRVVTLVIMIAVIFVGMCFIKGEAFYSLANISTIFANLSYDLLLACGMTFVLILGGIDLSVGSVLAFVGICTALMMKNGVPVPLAIILGLLIGMVCGCLNGILVAKFNIAPYLATLGSMLSLRGLCYVMTSGYFVSGLPESYSAIARGNILGISTKIVVSMVIMIVLGLLSRKHKAFKQMFYVGSNAQSAFLSGTPAARTKILGFGICSLLAGVAGILMTSSFGMGQAAFGVGYEMRAIAAAVIGGASMAGGEGNFIGTALGVILVALVNNVFIMFNGSPNWSTAISGIMLIVAVALDRIRTIGKKGD